MWTGNLVRHLSLNHLGHHRSIFPSFQWLRRNGVRCYSHNSADACGFPVRYISKNNRDVVPKQSPTDDLSLQQDIPSTSSPTCTPAWIVFPSKPLPVDTTPDLTHKDHVKVHHQPVHCINTPQLLAYNTAAEALNLNQDLSHHHVLSSDDELTSDDNLSSDDLSSGELVDEQCMEASEEVFEDAESHITYFKPKPDKTRQAAEKLAVQLLAKRAFSAVDLRKKLTAKLFPLNIVEAVLRDFQDRGMINDGLYAETFSHSRWKSSSWGPRRIKQALSKKGVSEPAVEKAVKLVFEDSEEGEQSSSVTLSSSSLHQLYLQASKQWQRSHNVHPDTRKTRVIRWLQYRGFDWGVIGSIIKKLESKSCNDPGRSTKLPP